MLRGSGRLGDPATDSLHGPIVLLDHRVPLVPIAVPGIVFELSFRIAAHRGFRYAWRANRTATAAQFGRAAMSERP
jgi:hypothetical protein